jgi:hypothetical protein
MPWHFYFLRGAGWEKFNQAAHDEIAAALSQDPRPVEIMVRRHWGKRNENVTDFSLELADIVESQMRGYGNLESLTDDDGQLVFDQADDWHWVGLPEPLQHPHELEPFDTGEGTVSQPRGAPVQESDEEDHDTDNDINASDVPVLAPAMRLYRTLAGQQEDGSGSQPSQSDATLMFIDSFDAHASHQFSAIIAAAARGPDQNIGSPEQNRHGIAHTRSRCNHLEDIGSRSTSQVVSLFLHSGTTHLLQANDTNVHGAEFMRSRR